MATPAAGDHAPPASRLTAWRVLQLLLAVGVVAFAAVTLWRQWQAVRHTGFDPDVRAGWLLAASVLVLATYALLIETWRRTLVAWGARLAFNDASRIWNVSNLGKYVPGKIWQVTAMTMMLQRRGVPLATSSGAAVVVTLANLVVGFSIVLLLGASTLDVVPGGPTAIAIAVALGAAGLLAAPALVPRLSSLAARLLRRDPPAVAMPAAAVWWSVAGCAVAWLLYGVAFRLFVVGVLGEARGSLASYVVVYTGSYLIGYIALFVPGGLGVRELALTASLPALGLATPPEAVLLTVASRLWLTALELIPGLTYLALGRRR